MNRKKKLTLLIVMLLSFSMFVSNLAGLNMVAQAADFDDFFTAGDDEESGYTEPEKNNQADPEYDDPEEEMKRQEQEEERRRQEQEEEQRQQEKEEEERRRAEEEAKREAEEEARRQAEEARKAAEAEEERQAEEARKAAEREAELQEALDKAAKEAEEEARRQAEQDAAAEEAKRQAEEEAKRAAEEAEKARKAAEEAKKEETKEYSYGIRTHVDGGAISNVNLSATVGEGDFLVFSAVNVGESDIDLVYGISGASGNVFALSLLSGSAELKIGDTDKFQIALNPAAPVGTYNCTIYLKDKRDNYNRFTKYINVNAKVTGSPKVTRVVVYPQDIRLAQGGSCNFHAEVQGRDGEISQDVSWNISGATSAGTYITGDGLLNVAYNEKANTFTVVATSVQDRSVSGTANVGIQKDSFSVNASSDPQKGGIVSGGGAVTRGGSVTLSAVPNKNYYFDGWIRDGHKVSTATNYTIDNIQCNINVTARFKRNYVTVTAIPENDQAGSVVGGGRITYGGRTTLSARAYDGFVFTGWKEGDSIISTSASLDLNNLTSDRKITARFSKTKYTITLSCNPFEGGSVTGNGTYKFGESATVTAKASSGYNFRGWTVNGQLVSRDLSYRIDRVDRDYSLTAEFIKEGIVTHTIVAGVATTGGTISPSGTIVAGHGASITSTITPKSGFAILAVAVDNVQVGPVSSYTFTDIKSDHAIAAAFVQTDAGAKAAEESGNPVQTKKVQKVYKEDTESVPEISVVPIEEAVSGTGGDDFVQEMDLSDIAIPSDEELGIAPEAEEPETTNVLKYLGITVDEARSMVDNGGGADILDAAFYEGYLNVYIDNQYAVPAEVPDYRSMSIDELEMIPYEYITPSMPNMDSVMEKLITPGELMALAQDGTANVSVQLKNADETVDDKSREVINGAVGQKPLRFFDLTIMKQVNGVAVNVKELAEPLEVIIRIPDDIYKDGKTYSILRDHNGGLTILPDLDDDPHTITFKTDKFSAYAISEQIVTPKNLAIRFAIGALVALVIALLCLVILMYHQIRMKRARRR